MPAVAWTVSLLLAPHSRLGHHVLVLEGCFWQTADASASAARRQMGPVPVTVHATHLD